MLFLFPHFKVARVPLLAVLAALSLSSCRAKSINQDSNVRGVTIEDGKGGVVFVYANPANPKVIRMRPCARLTVIDPTANGDTPDVALAKQLQQCADDNVQEREMPDLQFISGVLQAIRSIEQKPEEPTYVDAIITANRAGEVKAQHATIEERGETLKPLLEAEQVKLAKLKRFTANLKPGAPALAEVDATLINITNYEQELLKIEAEKTALNLEYDQKAMDRLDSEVGLLLDKILDTQLVIRFNEHAQDGNDAFAYHVIQAAMSSAPVLPVSKTTSAPTAPIMASGHRKALAQSPIKARSEAIAAVLGNKFLVMGGYDDGNVYPTDAASYDLTTSNWSTIANNPEIAYRAAASASFENKLIIWGGMKSSERRATNDGAIYDLKTDSWTPMAKGPLKSRRGSVCGVWNNKFIVWGGWSDKDSTLSDGALYDLTTEKWTPLPTFLPALYLPVSAVWGNKFFVWGTLYETGSQKTDGAAYDFETNTWARLETYPHESITVQRNEIGHAVVNDKLYIFNILPNPFVALGAILDLASGTWTTMPEAYFSFRIHDSFAVGDNKLIMVDPYENEGRVFDALKNEWTKISTPPLPGRGYAVATTGSKVIFWGGTTDKGGGLSDGAIYDVITNTWLD